MLIRGLLRSEHHCPRCLRVHVTCGCAGCGPSGPLRHPGSSPGPYRSSQYSGWHGQSVTCANRDPIDARCGELTCGQLCTLLLRSVAACTISDHGSWCESVAWNIKWSASGHVPDNVCRKKEGTRVGCSPALDHHQSQQSCDVTRLHMPFFFICTTSLKSDIDDILAASAPYHMRSDYGDSRRHWRVTRRGRHCRDD